MIRLMAASLLLLACWLGTPPGARAQELEKGKEELPPPRLEKGKEELPPPKKLPPPAELPPSPLMPSAPTTCPSCAPCPPRTICVPRMTLMEQQEATTIPRMRVREVVVGRACGLDVEYRKQNQVVTEWVLRPREVVQDVPCTTMVPVTVTDPCTGQCRTEQKAVPIVRQVKITVYDPVPAERLVEVAVPCLKPGNPLQVSKLVVDTTIEPAICTRMRLLTMPNEVHVPPCCALPPAP